MLMIAPAVIFFAKLSQLAEKWQIDTIQGTLAQALVRQEQSSLTHCDTPSDLARSES